MGAKPVALGDRAFDLLVLLIEQRHRVVPKDEMLRTVWHDRAVEDGNLHVQVATLRRRLGPDVIATVHGQGYRFTATLQAQLQAQQRQGNATATSPSAGSVPADRALLGRAALLSSLAGHLTAERLLTLVGPGGVGKTRLAQALMAEPPQALRDGVWWFELANVERPERLTQALVQGLRLHASIGDAAALAGQLQGMQALLVLDNAEHLLAAVAGLVGRLLDLAPGIRLLVTSRERLAHPLELAIEVPGLDLPSAALGPTSSCAAVALFEARARAAWPALAMTPQALADVVDICVQLEGLPLAIELAAARVPLLGVHGVRASLNDRLRAWHSADLQGPLRHRSLQGTLAWSYGLLDAPEQALLRALGVMTDSFTLDEAVQLVIAPGEDRWCVVDRFEALVRKSLLACDPAVPQRWRLLHTTRLFALQQLESQGETEAARGRHAETYARLFESLDQAWHTSAQPEIDIDARAGLALGQLCAALDWACSARQHHQQAARLFAHGARLLQLYGQSMRARAWADAVGPAPAAGLAPVLASRVLLAWSWVPPGASLEAGERLASVLQAIAALSAVGDGPRLQVAHVHAAQYAAQLGDAWQVDRSLAAAQQLQRPEDPPRLRACRLRAQFVHSLYFDLGQPPPAAALHDMLSDLEAAGDGQCRQAYIIRIGMAEGHLLEGRHAQARQALDALCTHVQTSTRSQMSAWFAPFDTLAMAELFCGDPAAARRSLQHAIKAARFANVWTQAAAVLAWFLAHQGRYRAALELLALAESRLHAMNSQFDALAALARSHAWALLRAACSADEISRWRDSAASHGPAGLQRLLGGSDPRFFP